MDKKLLPQNPQQQMDKKLLPQNPQQQMDKKLLPQNPQHNLFFRGLFLLVHLQEWD